MAAGHRGHYWVDEPPRRILFGQPRVGVRPGITDRAGWIPADYTPHHGGEITPELIRRAARHVAGATGLHYNQTAMLPLEVFADYLDLVVSGFKE